MIVRGKREAPSLCIGLAPVCGKAIAEFPLAKITAKIVIVGIWNVPAEAPKECSEPKSAVRRLILLDRKGEMEHGSPSGIAKRGKPLAEAAWAGKQINNWNRSPHAVPSSRRPPSRYDRRFFTMRPSHSSIQPSTPRDHRQA